MQNDTNFAVICNPKTPVELLKLHGHFREESILTLRHSLLFYSKSCHFPLNSSAETPLLHSAI